MADCIFCKIIKNEVSADKVYEDEGTLAFLDISPVNKGHVLVIPKQHFETLLDMPDLALEQTIKTVKKTAKAVISALNADGFNIGMNNYGAAGQLVMHVHFHVIPRFSKDGLKHWPGKKYKDNESKEIAKKINSELRIYGLHTYMHHCFNHSN